MSQIGNLALLPKYRYLAIPTRHQEPYRMLEHLFAFAVALGFAAQTGEKVSEQAVVTFNGIGFRFGLGVLRSGNKGFIGAPVIGHHISDSQRSYRLPEFLSCGCVPGTQCAVEEASPISINSNPNPAIVFLDPM